MGHPRPGRRLHDGATEGAQGGAALVRVSGQRVVHNNAVPVAVLVDIVVENQVEHIRAIDLLKAVGQPTKERRNVVLSVLAERVRLTEVVNRPAAQMVVCGEALSDLNRSLPALWDGCFGCGPVIIRAWTRDRLTL